MNATQMKNLKNNKIPKYLTIVQNIPVNELSELSLGIIVRCCLSYNANRARTAESSIIDSNTEGIGSGGMILEYSA